MLKGKKTYLTAIAGLAYAVGGYFAGYLDLQAAIEVGQVAVMGAFIRAGVNTARG